MAIRSQISAIIANQIGTLQGDLEGRIQEESIRLFNKFANQCPNREELTTIANTRNNLIKVVNNFQKLTNRYSKITNQLNPAIVAAKTLIRLLKANPIPSAIIPPSGGVGVTLGRIVTLSDRLRNANLLLESLEDDISSVNSLVESVGPSLDNTKQILESVNSSIVNCVEQIEDPQEILEIIKQIQPLENTGSEGTPNLSFTYRSINGKDYTLLIVEDRAVDVAIPRRVAIAQDNTGVIVLRGQPSFSSNTQVLLDELKFRIDNQLP